LVDQWRISGLPRSDLQGVTAPLQSALGELLQAAYAALHVLYDGAGVPQSRELAVLRRNTEPPQPALQMPAGTAQAASHPLLRVRHRAQEMVQQLRQLLTPGTRAGAAPADPSLLQALARQ